MNPAEIVKKVLRQHLWYATRWECRCGWVSKAHAQEDFHPHVAEEIVGALGLASQAHVTVAGAADKPHEHQWFEVTTYGDRADGFTEVMECSICGKEEKR